MREDELLEPVGKEIQFKETLMRTQSLDRDNLFMGLAIELARAAYDNDEVPVGQYRANTK